MTQCWPYVWEFKQNPASNVIDQRKRHCQYDTRGCVCVCVCGCEGAWESPRITVVDGLYMRA